MISKNVLVRDKKVFSSSKNICNRLVNLSWHSSACIDISSEKNFENGHYLLKSLNTEHILVSFNLILKFNKSERGWFKTLESFRKFIVTLVSLETSSIPNWSKESDIKIADREILRIFRTCNVIHCKKFV